MTTTVLVVAGAVATGIGSALLPLLNAEAYAVAAAATGRGTVLLALMVGGLALGQTVGKVVLFESARRGAGRLLRRHRRSEPSPRARRWAERTRCALGSPRTGPLVVLASAGLGVPPLAVTSVAAGAAHQPRRVFIPVCLVGRAVRFAVLVLPLAQLWS